MTQQEIEETAKLMEEGKLDLVDWVDNQLKERMESLGFTLITEEPEQKEDAPVTGTITFLKGESAEKAAKYFKNKKADE